MIIMTAIMTQNNNDPTKPAVDATAAASNEPLTATPVDPKVPLEVDETAERDEVIEVIDWPAVKVVRVAVSTNALTPLANRGIIIAAHIIASIVIFLTLNFLFGGSFFSFLSELLCLKTVFFENKPGLTSLLKDITCMRLL
ncbi:hypothetical protein COV19_07155 [Candidatus Woesearchaeota archaeon CG10_big_fil_rev_8_21_14_0_10_44_13]|nr:MAG: hypothetical protein COV19_07155 [Candidatus Woesearchaeota archaeon CG10_big_fil_rev_8_21_14_0_10_44_13]